jgi:hypothetical protein
MKSLVNVAPELPPPPYTWLITTSGDVALADAAGKSAATVAAVAATAIVTDRVRIDIGCSYHARLARSYPQVKISSFVGAGAGFSVGGMGEQPGPFTVTDLFDLRSCVRAGDPPADPARLTATATALRALAARLDDVAGVLSRGQAGLGEMLERLDVPSLSGPGTLTFYPFDAADVAKVATALQAAAQIRAAVLAKLA